MSTALFDPIKTQAKMTDSVIVGFSGGKDSIVTLDLCVRYFKNVTAYFLYSVPWLSYQERCLRVYEEKYGINIIRLPNTDISNMLQSGTYTIPNPKTPIITNQDIYDYLRDETGMWWISGGERASDSIERNAMLKKIGSANFEMGRFYPVAYWKEKEILNYIKVKKLPYFDMREALTSPEVLYEIREFFPDDWKKMLRVFPFIGVEIERVLKLERENKNG